MLFLIVKLVFRKFLVWLTIQRWLAVFVLVLWIANETSRRMLIRCVLWLTLVPRDCRVGLRLASKPYGLCGRVYVWRLNRVSIATIH